MDLVSLVSDPRYRRDWLQVSPAGPSIMLKHVPQGRYELRVRVGDEVLGQAVSLAPGEELTVSLP